MDYLSSVCSSCTLICHPLSTTFVHGGYSDKRLSQSACEYGICMQVKSTDSHAGIGFVPRFGGKQIHTQNNLTTFLACHSYSDVWACVCSVCHDLFVVFLFGPGTPVVLAFMHSTDDSWLSVYRYKMQGMQVALPLQYLFLLVHSLAGTSCCLVCNYDARKQPYQWLREIPPAFSEADWWVVQLTPEYALC